MKKLLLLLVLLLCGCGTTFQERKEVYVSIYNKVISITKTVGPIAAEVYLDKKVSSGQITIEDKQKMLNSLNTNLKK